MTYSSYTNIGILQNPKTQIVLPGEDATFSCNVSRWGWWNIGGKHNETDWNSRGIVSIIVESTNADPIYTTTAMTLRIKGVLANNGSEIQCIAYDDSVDTTTSDAAYLIIAGEFKKYLCTVHVQTPACIYCAWYQT